MARLLLVDDEQANLDLHSLILQREGFDVATAANGAEALEAVRANRPDLVIMDMEMPVMDGRQAATALKSDPATRSLPVIALTSNSHPGAREECLRAGCDDYTTKPLDPRQLASKIRALLPAHT
jgi:two-component system, cell cycle response regulator DivK